MPRKEQKNTQKTNVDDEALDNEALDNEDNEVLENNKVDNKKLDTKDEDNDDESLSKDDDIEMEKEDGELEVSKIFEKKANEFLKLDNMCKDLTKKKNELEAQKKPLEDYILKYLDKTGHMTIDFPNGTKLRRNKSETKEPVKLDHFKAALKEKLNDDLKINEILKTMETMRETKVNVNLKRTGPRSDNMSKPSKSKSNNN
jgi:hypothetical protein